MEKKEAMKILKDFYDKSALFSIRTALDTVIPELKESDDEKIRKTLINFFDGWGDKIWDNGIKYSEVVAWLRKQGVHANFRNKIQEGDHVTRNDNGELVNLSQLERVAKQSEPVVRENKGNDGGISPNSAWSEEDEGIRNELIKYFTSLLECIATEERHIENRRWLNWLKSLKDRVGNFDDGYKVGFSAAKHNQWKPSDEQMNFLEELVEDNNQRHFYTILRSLYEQLKELREE